jgi:hypothetical protein
MYPDGWSSRARSRDCKLHGKQRSNRRAAAVNFSTEIGTLKDHLNSLSRSKEDTCKARLEKERAG